MNLLAGWSAVTSSPLFGITLTVGAYVGARLLWDRFDRPSLLNPVLVAVTVVIAVLAVTGVDYDTYLIGGAYIAFLLGPATVALALPLWRQWHRVRRSVFEVLGAVSVGCVASIVAAVLFTRWAGGTAVMVASMSPKSATTPISIAMSQQVGGIPELSAVFTIVSGVLGAVAGPRILSLLRLQDPEVRGLAMGVSAHGIATARSLHEHPSEGAFAGLAMGLNALATSLLVPPLLAWLT